MRETEIDGWSAHIQLHLIRLNSRQWLGKKNNAEF